MHTQTLLPKPPLVGRVLHAAGALGGRGRSVPSNRSSHPLQATQRVCVAVLITHIILLLVNSFSWGQLTACAICVVVSSTMLCKSVGSRSSLTTAGVLLAVGSLLDAGQVVRWLRKAFIVHQNNMGRPAADRVPMVLLSAVIVPAALGAYCCGHGAATAFAAAGICGRRRRYRGSGAPDMLPVSANPPER